MAINLVEKDGNFGIGETELLSRLTVRAKEPYELTGTVAKTAASASLAGTATAFLSEVGIGDILTVPGGGGDETRYVIGVASDTSLTVEAEFGNTASAQTATNRPATARFVAEDGVSQMLIAGNGEVRIGPVVKPPTGADGVGAILHVHAATDVPYIMALTNTRQLKAARYGRKGLGLTLPHFKMTWELTCSSLPASKCA